MLVPGYREGAGSDLLSGTSFLLTLFLQGHGGHLFLFLLTSVHLPEPRRPRDLRKWRRGGRKNQDLVLVIFRIPRDRKAVGLHVPPASSFLSKSP